MNWTILLRKLIAIERQVGKADADTLRSLLYDVEDCLVQMQEAKERGFFEEALIRTDEKFEFLGGLN